MQTLKTQHKELGLSQKDFANQILCLVSPPTIPSSWMHPDKVI
jgi:hypothetical protein